MSSLRRILASRANGARSRGPKTPLGKLRSSQNALRHALLSKYLVLSNESREGFQAFLREHLERFCPADGVELGLIEEMVAAWRLRRVWAAETRLIDNAVSAHPSADELDRLTAAFSKLASSRESELFQRYETRFHNMYQRSLYSLLLLRTVDLPNEPSPPPGHSLAIEPPPVPGPPLTVP